ncbi:MAG: DUF4293 domain-containing protein [Bacteroidales bacterium]|nr:DUF4293 domain-containing protein [Bacteroidales bacterium]
MIQRIQSIYMLLAVILCGLTYFFPLSLVVVEDGIALTLTACTVSGEVAGESVSGTPFGIAVLLLATIVIVLTAIFKYKRRKVQIRLLNMAMVCLLLCYVAGIAYTWVWSSRVSEGHAAITPYALLPLAAYLCLWFARRGVRHDEALVAAADRLR